MLKNQENLIKIAKDLNFDLNEDEINDLLNKSEHVLNNINKIRNFDLSKYENYRLKPVFQTRLRDDEVVINDDKDIFKNCVDFDGEYVVINHEK